VSLGVIVVVLVVVTVASLVKTRHDPAATAHAGSLTTSPRAKEPVDQRDR
jgi:tellurite resistance protein TerC